MLGLQCVNAAYHTQYGFLKKYNDGTAIEYASEKEAEEIEKEDFDSILKRYQEGGDAN